MTTGLRECCGIISTTIGPWSSPVQYRPLPRSTGEIRKYLKAAIRVSDAEKWHETQLDKIAAHPALEGTDFRGIVQEVGAWFLKGCKRVEDLKLWTENGLLPHGFYNERHLLNTALGHIKSAFESMEIIAKTQELRRLGGPARPIAIQYFCQVYILLLVLVKVAYGKEFDDYFEEWDKPLVDPDRIVEFDTLDPNGLYIESDIRDISLATVMPPIDQVPERDFLYRDARPTNIPRVFVNNGPYGNAIVLNALADQESFQRGERSTG